MSDGGLGWGSTVSDKVGKGGEQPDQVSKKRGDSLAEAHTYDGEYLCRKELGKQLNKAQASSEIKTRQV